MKKIVIMYLLLLPVLAFAKVKTAVISLNLTEVEQQYLRDSGRKPRLELLGYEFLGHEFIEAQQGQNGQWHFVLPDPMPQYATLTVWGNGTRTVFIAPGMELNVSVIPDKGFSYKGKGADINNYLNTAPYNGISSVEMKLSEKELISNTQKGLQNAIEMLQKAKLDKKFTTLETERLRLMFVGKYNSYISIYDKFNQKAYVPSAEFVEHIVNQFVENEDYFFLDEYKQLAWAVLGLKWKAPQNIQNREDETLSKINFVTDYFKGEKIREYLIGSTVITHIRNAGLKDTARIEPLFRQYVHDPNIIKMHADLCEKLTSDTDKILNKLAANGKMKCPSFTFTDINGKKVSIEDFRGKYVYIDCWATWCGPCKAELPALQKLEEKYKDRNIVFVSISSDRDKKAWEKMVKLDKLGGIQLNIGDDQSFHKAMKISSIPRFMLVDPEGYFVSDNATRPSNSQTEILFDSLKGL